MDTYSPLVISAAQSVLFNSLKCSLSTCLAFSDDRIVSASGLLKPHSGNISERLCPVDFYVQDEEFPMYTKLLLQLDWVRF